ncbi:serine hydrolase [Myroides sp. LJL119]
MMKQIILALFIGIIFHNKALSQDLSKVIDPMQEFFNYYQQKDFTGFHSLYSPALKSKVDMQKSADLAFSLSQGFGDITNFELYNQPKDNYYIYKVYFSSGDIFLFQIELTPEAEVDYFQIFNLPKTQNQIEFLDADYAQTILQNVDSLVPGTNISVALINDQHVDFLDINQTKKKLVITQDKSKIYSILNLTDVFTNTMLSKAIWDKEIGLGAVANDFYDFKFNKNLELNLVALSNQTTSLPILPDVSVSLENMQTKHGTVFLKQDLENYLENYIQKDSTNASAYSYINGAIIADVLQKHYDKSYKELLQKVILEPFEMKNTFIELPKRKRNVVANTDQRPYVYLNQSDAFIPSIGAYSTTEDLAKFIQGQFSKDSYIGFSQRPTTIISNSILASIAWKLEHTFYNKDRVFFNTGLSASFVNIVVFDPKAKKGLVLLSNINQEAQQEQLFDLANLLMIKLLYGKDTALGI